jgi:hypothetical protein
MAARTICRLAGGLNLFGLKVFAQSRRHLALPALEAEALIVPE